MKASNFTKKVVFARVFWLLTIIATFTTTQTSAQNYCSSSGPSTFFSYIDEVNFDGINNVSGNNHGYADFTNQTANVTPGSSYNITIDAVNTFSFFSSDNRFRVWIDFNADGDFFDSGELVLQDKAKNTASGTIHIPAGVAGATRMRVSMNRFGYPNPCSHFSYGEVEDYTITFGPVNCTADAGTLTAEEDTVCAAGGNVMIAATADGNAIVPAGYVNAYVLTSGTGLVIEQTNTIPEFTVTGEGLYTIHSLVFDSNTLDLGIVVPGTTTGFDIFGLIVAGGGTICASLDVAGAPIFVENPYAGTLTPDNFFSCVNSAGSAISATINDNPVIPSGYSSLYVLTRGQGLVIEQVNATPSFTVNAEGIYRIHTLVYNPATLNLSIVVPGTTTGFDVNGLLVQGGGNICASLDVAGAPFLVFPSFICDFFGFKTVGERSAYSKDASYKNAEGTYKEIMRQYEMSLNASVELYPNPTVGKFNIDISNIADEQFEIRIVNTIGQVVYREVMNTDNQVRIELDASGFRSGVYFVQVKSGLNTYVNTLEVK